MRAAPWIAFGAVEFVAAVGLAIWYGVRYGDCAPPSIYCLLGGSACSLLCENAWAQFPEVMLLGAALGFVPALLLALATVAYRKGPLDREGT